MITGPGSWEALPAPRLKKPSMPSMWYKTPTTEEPMLDHDECAKKAEGTLETLAGRIRTLEEISGNLLKNLAQYEAVLLGESPEEQGGCPETPTDGSWTNTQFAVVNRVDNFLRDATRIVTRLREAL